MIDFIDNVLMVFMVIMLTFGVLGLVILCAFVGHLAEEATGSPTIAMLATLICISILVGAALTLAEEIGWINDGTSLIQDDPPPTLCINPGETP